MTARDDLLMALRAAETHEAGLTELYRRLRSAGHAYAFASAHAAAEATHDLVLQLRSDLQRTEGGP